MFKDWEQLNNVKRQGKRQYFLKIGSIAAMFFDSVHIGKVLRLGIAQHCNKTRYDPTLSLD